MEVLMGMNINLTSKLEDMVRDKVASGLYTSASEVVREALRLMEEQDRLRAAGLEQLQSDIRERFSSSPVTAWSAEDINRATRNFLLWPNTR
jgi:antitoxin ParD1/3/4